MDIVKRQLKLFDWASRQHRNSVIFDTASGKAHRLAIMDFCKDCIKNEVTFYTRMRLMHTPFHKDQLIADIYLPESNAIIEFIDSETNASIERKRRIWTKLGFTFFTESVTKK